jgi:hypothetical protein
MIEKYTSCQYYILKVHIIYKPFPIQGPPKFTQIVIFGLKICHLATLIQGCLTLAEEKKGSFNSAPRSEKGLAQTG